MTAELQQAVEAAAEAALDDYVDMDRLWTVVTRQIKTASDEEKAQRTALVLDALVADTRVVVVEAADMLTPVAPNIGARYLEMFHERGEVQVGDLAWVMDVATWERDVARKTSGTTPDA